MIHLLDTHERKTLNFIPDAFPDATIAPLEVGDWLSYEKKLSEHKCLDLENSGFVKKNGKLELEQKWVTFDTEEILVGNLVEFKIGTDFGIHTEPLERFRDECYRMRVWQKQNPYVDLHAVWATSDYQMDLHSIRLFFDICFQYNVWGHVFNDNYQPQLIQFLKDLDQPKSYQRDVPFMKRSDEPTTLARMFRQIHGVSSELAIQLAINLPPSFQSMFYPEFNDRLKEEVQDIIIETVGRKKNREPKKLAEKIIKFLETGEES